MNIAESDIAILIPAYYSAEFIERCLKSAIKTRAGEIIICDDCSSDSTENILRQFNDNRIKFFKNTKTLGLWENHYQLLKLSTKPWIKFLQADDYIEEGGLSLFCDNEEQNLSIISALSINENIITKDRSSTFKLTSKRRWDSKTYLERLKIVGNELGTPSNTLIKKEYISLNPAHWKTTTSADLIMNVLAASKGEVVLLPPGPLIRGIHHNQDTNKQSLSIFIDRLKNSVKILLNTDNFAIKEFTNIFLFVESLGIIRMITGQMLRGKLSSSKYFLCIIKNITMFNFTILFKNLSYIRKMFNWKYGKRETFDLDF